MSEHRNEQLWEAYLALRRIGETALPKTFPTQVKFRLTLNRNHLRPVFEALDEQRRTLVEQHQVGDAFIDDPARLQRLAVFNKEWLKLMGDKTEWSPAGTIEAKRFPDDTEGLRANDLGDLLAVGIIIEPDSVPEEKRR